MASPKKPALPKPALPKAALPKAALPKAAPPKAAKGSNKTVSSYPYFDTFKRNSTNLIGKIGEANAYMIWALGLYLEEPDLEALASEALMDTNNDKNIDFLYLDRDEKKLVIAQGFYAQIPRDTAPDSKAASLNTSIAWLFSGELDSIPEDLKEAIAEFRRANDAGEVEAIELIYVHNLAHSINVFRELKTLADHLQSTIGNANKILVSARELSAPIIQTLYASQESHIDVKELVSCPASSFIEQKGPSWIAIVVSVPGKWLYELFAQHDQSLFSANYRGFLGINKRRKINSAIKDSAENSESDFWVYNNGITLLTLGIEHKGKHIILNGVSIINGAQTTGSIGKVDIREHNLEGVQVLCRIIRCDDPEKVNSIVKYNNTQNNITTWDQYSGDVEQVRIESEFVELNHIYSRKRGFRVSNNLDQIGIEDVAQPLVAFKGRYGAANAGKNNIFERAHLYKLAFESKKARHILFVYALARAIDERRLELKKKASERSIISLEEKHLKLLRHLRFKNFFLALLPKVLEPIVGWRVDVDTIAFNPKAAKASENSLADLVAACVPMINKVLAFVSTQLDADDLYTLIQNEDESKDEALGKLASTVSTQLYTSNTGENLKEFTILVSHS